VSKAEQVQIRVTAEEKTVLKRLARAAGQDLSSFVLSRALPQHRLRFQELTEALSDGDERRFALAELNDLLANLTRTELVDAVGHVPPAVFALPPYWQNYVAAMVEQAADRKGVAAPEWLSEIEPLTEPHFGAPLGKLRLHLLRVSPVPFRRRNIFVDAGIGDRV
jgi:uncharacterized protein (DUF1778 family)